jgi:FkbM family methyltransferase
MIEFIKHLKSRGMQFPICYDVGACNGSWSNKAKREVLPESSFYLFEANAHYLSDLIVTGHSFFLNVLSNEGREFVEFYPGCNTGDSYYKETTTWYDGKTPVKMSCTTLDKMIENKDLPVPNLLKIDTQGSELDILSAAKKVMGKTELIFCETPLIEYNQGAPNISEYLTFFRDYDYIPVELLEVHQAEGIIFQLDFAFMLRSAKNEFLGECKTIRV